MSVLLILAEVLVKVYQKKYYSHFVYKTVGIVAFLHHTMLRVYTSFYLLWVLAAELLNSARKIFVCYLLKGAQKLYFK